MNLLYKEQLKVAARSVSYLSTSPSTLMLIGAFMGIIIGHEQGLLKDEYYNLANGVLLFLTTYYIIVFGFKIIFQFSEPYSENKQYQVGRAASMSVNSEEDASVSIIRRRAVHEAGHIIAISIFTKTPDNLYAWISLTTNGISERGGQVGYRYPDDEETTSIRLTERMLFCILPLKAEELILEEPSVGSSSDMSNWELAAKTLLNNFPSKLSWYRAPANDIESNINATTLKDMLDTDLEKAELIVEKNTKLINEIANCLIENKKLEHNDIIAFINHVSH